MISVEVVWLGRDNAIARQLLVNGLPVDLTSYTDYAIRLNTAVIRHSQTAGVFTAQANGILDIKLGAQALTPGQYEAQIVLFNASNSNGIAFDVFPLVVR